MPKLKWIKATAERLWQSHVGIYILQITNYVSKEYIWTIFDDKANIITSGIIDPGNLDGAKEECVYELRKRLLAKRARLDLLLQQL
jgi:hypothetical protein